MAAQLRAAGIRPDIDRLDQHLLIDEVVLEMLTHLPVPHGSLTVLDPGAGPGTITTRLAQRGARVIAVELDRQFQRLLDDIRLEYPMVDIVIGNLRDFDLARVNAIIGNPPYGVLHHLARALSQTQLRHGSMLVPGRFAASAIASPGSSGFNRTSLMLQSLHAARAITSVEPAAFLPMPQVSSHLLALSPSERPRSFQILARWIVAKPASRVRDLAARLGWRRAALGAVRPQARLQSLSNGDVSAFAALAMEDADD